MIYFSQTLRAFFDDDDEEFMVDLELDAETDVALTDEEMAKEHVDQPAFWAWYCQWLHTLNARKKWRDKKFFADTEVAPQ